MTTTITSAIAICIMGLLLFIIRKMLTDQKKDMDDSTKDVKLMFSNIAEKMTDAVNSLKDSISDLRLEMANHYVKSEALDKIEATNNSMHEKIWEELEKLRDKQGDILEKLK